MVHVDYKISYPGLTKNDEERLAQLIQATIQHEIVSIACRMVTDPVFPATEGKFISSLKLHITGSVTSTK